MSLDRKPTAQGRYTPVIELPDGRSIGFKEEWADGVARIAARLDRTDSYYEKARAELAAGREAGA